MQNLKTLYKETKEKFDSLEKEIVDMKFEGEHHV